MGFHHALLRFFYNIFCISTVFYFLPVSCFKHGIIRIPDTINAVQSAKGVAHAIPPIPSVPLKIIINITSRLPFLRNARTSGCTFFPIAWNTVIAMKFTAVVGHARQMIRRKCCPKATVSWSEIKHLEIGAAMKYKNSVPKAATPKL